ncbi:MAG: cation:proton antiporter [Saprospiraceae bacterium]
MSTTIIITICALLIIAYVFDISSAKTRIPSVILLLALGWGVRQITDNTFLSIPDLTPALPILGTVGLILIVMEGSLEVELNPSKFKTIFKSSVLALMPMVLLVFGLAWALEYYFGTPFKLGLANAIPLAVISSAIAIPSVHNLPKENKEFVTYESSLSDILGVLLFNFITLNDNIGSQTIGKFSLQILIIILISFLATLALSYLLNQIKFHVKFVPIMLLVILIYTVSKEYHLPSLVFILLFGLFLGNLDELKRFKWIDKFQPELLNKEVIRFKEIVHELTFLIRALFFLLFGYLIETSELMNSETIIWAIAITAGIFILRAIWIKVLRLKLDPLVYVAPRGLITILLFLSLPGDQVIPMVNKSLIIQVIILTALVMMFGLMKFRKELPSIPFIHHDAVETENSEITNDPVSESAESIDNPVT